MTEAVTNLIQHVYGATVSEYPTQQMYHLFQHMCALLTTSHAKYQLLSRTTVWKQLALYGFINGKIITHLHQFWKYVKCKCLVVRQEHMA